MTTRSVLGLIYTVHAINNMGIETADILTKYGFSLQNLDPFAQIDRAQELQILLEIVQQLDDVSAGLQLGTRFGIAGYGPFSLMLMTSPTAYDACKLGIQYQALAYLYGTMELDLTPGTTGLSLYPANLPESIRTFLIDRDLAGTYQLLKDIMINQDDNFSLDEVWIPHPKPTTAKPYEELFQCPVKFDQPHGKLVISNIELSHAFPQSNALACKLYQAQCDQLIEARAAQISGLTGKVSQYLNLFEYRFPKTSDVATLFSISERSLRRQLAKESTSYQTILNSVRYHRARKLLTNSKLPIETIADKLGYSEPSAFNHAFTKWSGTSPRDYRKHPTYPSE